MSDLQTVDTRKTFVAPDAGRVSIDAPVTHAGDALGHDGHFPTVTQSTAAAVVELIGQIRELNRQRSDLKRAEQPLTLRVKAICRRMCDGDKEVGQELYKMMLQEPQPDAFSEAARLWCDPLLRARSIIETEIKPLEKRLAALVIQLPIWQWADKVRGLGPLSVGQIVGEAGDIGSYSNPAKLWKRFGLHVMADGEAARMRRGEKADYAPYRRAIMYVIGENLIRAKNPEYRAVYDERKAYEEAREAQRPHARAKRYMEKRLLRNLWKAWRHPEGSGPGSCDTQGEAA